MVEMPIDVRLHAGLPVMEDLDELILMQLKGIGKDVGNVIVGLLNNDISQHEQIGFAHRLVDIAEAIRERATRTHGMVIEGGASDGGNGRVLPSGTDTRQPYRHRGR